MSGNYPRLFAKYTDEQLLELASQRGTLVDAARVALDEEMSVRGFNPHEEVDIKRDVGRAEQEIGRNINAIAAFFLRAKHWQIFFLLVGVMFVGEVGMTSSMKLFLGMTMLWGFCFLAWFWSVGSFLTSIVQPRLKLKMGFFRFAVIYPALYFPVFIATLPNSKPSVLAIIVPLHLFAMVCMFYLLYFVSKSLVLAETGKPASFYDYAGPFFLIWFIPIGAWIIQPRINRLYDLTKERLATA